MREEYKNWINRAEADFRKAKILLDNNEFDGVAFFSQQTAEKSLKSAIIKKYGELVKIHDLVILGRRINLPNELLQKCERLSLAYTASRYGISLQKFPAKNFTKENVQQFFSTAKEVLEWAKKM